MTKTLKNQVDMRTGSIPKKIMSFAIPLMLTSMLQLVYNAADVIVVGRFAGTESLSAVGSTGALINLLINVFMGLSIGTSVTISKCFGARDEEGMQTTIHTSIALALISGIALTFVGFFLAEPLLTLMSTPESVLVKATVYVKLYFCGMIFNLVFNFGAAALRAVGDIKRPLKILATAGIVNVVLNLIFVVLLHMDVAGVALATITAQAVSMVWVIKCLMNETGGLKLNLRKLKIDKEKALIIIKIGVPAGIQSSMFSISNVLLQSAINTFGAVTIAGNAAASSIEGFMYVTMNSLHQSAITFTSQNIGAKNYARVRKCLINCLGLAVVFAVVVCGLCYIFATPLTSLYDSDPEVIEIASWRLRFICTFYLTIGCMDILTGQLRGLGASLMPMIISIIGVCLYRVFWVTVVFEKFPTLEVLLYSYPTSWLLTFLMLLPIYFIILKKLPKEDFSVNY